MVSRVLRFFFALCAERRRIAATGTSHDGSGEIEPEDGESAKQVKTKKRKRNPGGEQFNSACTQRVAR